MTTITYHGFENEGIIAHVKAIMEDYRALLPNWINSLSVVSCGQDGEGNCLKVHYNQHEYMHARISVFPVWFDQTEERQRIGIIHEMVHIQHAALLDFAESHLIDPIKERNPELHDYIHEEFRVKLERFTESAAIGIYRALEAAKARRTSPVFGPSVSPFEENRLKPTPGVSRDILKEMERVQGVQRSVASPACAKCGGGQGSDLRAGARPGIWFCCPCWDSEYQHGNGAEPAKPYTGVQAIDAKRERNPMKIIVHLLCIVACLPTFAASLEDRLAEIAAVDGVEVASIVTDPDTKEAELSEMPGFPGWRMARIAYLIVSDGAVQDNTIAVVIAPDGSALWSQREPAILAETPERVGNIGTEEEIIAEIERTQSVMALKYNIDFDTKGADVLIVVEVSGKAIERHYRVYKDSERFVVKPYDVTAETSEITSK